MSIAVPSRRRSPSLTRLYFRNASALLRSRRQLSQLTKEQLQDVGISAEEARAEATRPIWDAPALWKY